MTHNYLAQDQTTNDQDPKNTVAHSNAMPKRTWLFSYIKHTEKTYNDAKDVMPSELDEFLRDKSDQTNVLLSKSDIYSLLNQLALRYLTVLATSKPVERVLCSGRFVMSPHRAPSSAENVCIRTFLKCNRSLFSGWR